MEQGASRSRSELVLLRLHRDAGVGRVAGVALRRQARVRSGHSADARRHHVGAGSCARPRRAAHRTARHHGPRLRTYSCTGDARRFTVAVMG